MRYFNTSYKILNKEIENLLLHNTISRRGNMIADAIQGTISNIIKQKFIGDWQIYRYKYALSVVLECLKMDAQTNIICSANKDCYETISCFILNS